MSASILHSSPLFFRDRTVPPTPVRVRRWRDVAEDQDAAEGEEERDAVVVRMSPTTSMQIGCVEASWVTIRNTKSGKDRAAQVKLYSPPPSQDGILVFLSPSLMFNLGLSEDVEASVVCRGTWPALPVRRVLLDSPPVASSITIARVKSPESSGHEDYSNDIRRHFESVKRTVRVGDVFIVTVQEAIEATESKDEGTNGSSGNSNSGAAHSIDAIDLTEMGIVTKSVIPHPEKLVFFQVTNVQLGDEHKDYRLDVLVDATGDTALKQVGAVHSRIPDLSLPNDYLEPRLYKVLLPALTTDLLGTRPDVALLLCGPRGSGKRRTVRTVAKKCNVHYKQISMTSARGLPQDRVVTLLEEAFQEAAQVAPCILLLSNLESLTPVGSAGKEKPDDPDQIALAIRRLIRSRKQPVVGTAIRFDEVSPVIRGCFTHEIEYAIPDRTERLELLKALAEKVKLDDQVSLEDLAAKTAGRNALDLRSLVSDAGHRASLADSAAIEAKYFEKALDSLPGAMDELSTAAPKIPEVRWDDVGGLMHAKDEILDMIQLPLKRPDLFASGMRSRSGILLFGPPGTGKTLLAKAVATECGMNFISVKGPELLDMYIGESERKVRQVFETARAAKPCVLFFDELDSLAPQRGRGSDSGGVMDRVVSQLLTEIDGMAQKGSGDVFVIGATNRPDLLDSSLLRPGRFDRLIYLGICQDRHEQLKIVSALTRKYAHEPGVDLLKVLENAPLNLTGADFYALCSGAMSNALKRRVSELYEQAKARGIPPRKLLSSMSEEELKIRVSMEDYQKAMSTLVPSVSEQEIKHYERLRDKFANKDSKALLAAVAESAEEGAVGSGGADQSESHPQHLMESSVPLEEVKESSPQDEHSRNAVDDYQQNATGSNGFHEVEEEKQSHPDKNEIEDVVETTRSEEVSPKKKETPSSSGKKTKGKRTPIKEKLETSLDID